MSLVGVGVEGGETQGKNITEEACGGNRLALRGSTVICTGMSCQQARGDRSDHMGLLCFGEKRS